MLLKEVKLEATENQRGQVLKRISTSEFECSNRQLPVNKGLYHIEKDRLRYNCSVLLNPIQTHHIRYDKKKKVWMDSDLEAAKLHAQNQNRIFIPYLQKIKKALELQTWAQSENEFQNFVSKNIQFVPYQIPPNAPFEEWEKRKETALSIIHKHQELIPIIPTNMNIIKFEKYLESEFKDNKLLGFNCDSLSNAYTFRNLSSLWLKTHSTKIGSNVPWTIGFGIQRMFPTFSHISAAVAYSFFGIDVYSERVFPMGDMPPEVREKITQQKPEDFFTYDPIQAGFTQSENQNAWYENDVTRQALSEINLNQGIEGGYKGIRWLNFLTQKQTLHELNSAVFEGMNKLIENHSRITAFWDLNLEQKRKRIFMAQTN